MIPSYRSIETLGEGVDYTCARVYQPQRRTRKGFGLYQQRTKHVVGHFGIGCFQQLQKAPSDSVATNGKLFPSLVKDWKICISRN
jgi:hypothetical protein